MSKKEKLIKRLKSKPKDFSFDELVTLMMFFGYVLSNKGKTSGSRVTFLKESCASVSLHKPHPDNTLKHYQVQEILDFLEQEGLL